MGCDARDLTPLPYTGRTYTITDGTWAGGPALRSFERIADDWALDGPQRAAALGVDPALLNEWTSEARTGDFPLLPDDVFVALSNVLVLRRELTGRGVADQDGWLRRPYDDSLFCLPGNQWYAPSRPIEATPMETMLKGGVRWVREIFHPRGPLSPYICPDYEMLATEDHDWLPAPSRRALISGPALRSFHKVMDAWGVGDEIRERLGAGPDHHGLTRIAQNYGHVELDQLALARISHVLHVRECLFNLAGPDADQWAFQRAWLREPHPELFGDDRTPAEIIAHDHDGAFRVRCALAHLSGLAAWETGPDIYDERVLCHEVAPWLPGSAADLESRCRAGAA